MTCSCRSDLVSINLWGKQNRCTAQPILYSAFGKYSDPLTFFHILLRYSLILKCIKLGGVCLFFFPLTLFGLFFALTCTVSCGTLYRQLCAFPNHVQSMEFTTGGLQSSCRNVSRMINGNRMDLSSILSLIAKLSAYITSGKSNWSNEVKTSKSDEKTTT